MSYVLGLMVGAIFMVLMIPVFIIGYFHTEITLKSFSGELTSIQVPESTTLLDSVTEFGSVSAGNGDHCDYLAGILFETNASKQYIESWYKSQYRGKSQVEFVWLDEDNAYTNSDERWSASGPLLDMVAGHTSSSTLGMAYIFKEDATFDLRCML